MLLLRFYHHAVPLLSTILIIAGLINCARSRSVDADELKIDRSDVPARYVFEIDEVQDDSLSEIKKRTPKEKEYSNSDLVLHMPIAAAVFCAVLFLVCCFCCLRCAVTYDGIKRSGTYGGSENSGVTVVDIKRRFKSNNEPIKK